MLADEALISKAQDLRGWLYEWQRKQGATGLRLNLPKEALEALGLSATAVSAK